MKISFSGIVLHGAKRGKALGFPTANIALAQKIEEGIYVGEVTLSQEQKTYRAAIFIGKAETFTNATYQAEVHLLDFAGDLYGKNMEVTLLEKIRDNKKFDSAEQLQKQIAIDIAQTKAFFLKNT